MPDNSEFWLPPSCKPKRSSQSFKHRLTAVYLWTGLPGKTLWDILQLLGVLAIPVVVVIASSLISIQLNQENLRTSEQQHQTDIQISTDQQREATLQNYLDSISGLLLKNNLLQSQPGDAVREVARVQTLITLRRLDPPRKVILLHFLLEAGLIGYVQGSDQSSTIVPAIILMNGADLSDTNLFKIDLAAAYLVDVNLKGANLSHSFLGLTNLNGADLNYANLSHAYLYRAVLTGDLNGTDLTDADLKDAELNSANLSGTILTGANLNGADLNNTNLTQQQLDHVSSCKQAILPAGLTCPQNLSH